jgi:hypothetical protein
MTTQSSKLLAGFEEALISTVRDLPPRRAVLVLDFARWLGTQSQAEEWLADDFTSEELQAEEATWDKVYLENRETFRSMAREAIDDYEAGETEAMVIKDGKLSAP